VLLLPAKLETGYQEANTKIIKKESQTN